MLLRLGTRITTRPPISARNRIVGTSATAQTVNAMKGTNRTGFIAYRKNSIGKTMPAAGDLPMNKRRWARNAWSTCWPRLIFCLNRARQTLGVGSKKTTSSALIAPLREQHLSHHPLHVDQNPGDPLDGKAGSRLLRPECCEPWTRQFLPRGRSTCRNSQG